MIKESLRRIHDYLWEIPKQGGMRVPGRVYGTREFLDGIEEDAFQQVANVAWMPGILRYSIAMPDIHSGYGFPIGGVAAFSKEEGIISPGAVGFDINCGLRLLTTGIKYKEFRPKLRDFVDKMFKKIPIGLGSKSSLRVGNFEKVLVDGVSYLREQGYVEKKDVERIEEHGSMAGADPSKVSDTAKKRGISQLGSIGSGNHFVEALLVDEIYNPEISEFFDIRNDEIVFMIHTGSRGLGHQIATDYIKTMLRNYESYGFKLPDKQLVGAPYNRPEAQNYLKAMACAINFAFSNRQIATFFLRELLEKEFSLKPEEVKLVYDHAHNIVKHEKHKIEGDEKEILVYRKGATRAFTKERPELFGDLKVYGQPCLIPGSMGTPTYVMIPEEKAMTETFGTINHGAGRRMSRKRATQEIGRTVFSEMEKLGKIVRSTSRRSMMEESPRAYKDIDVVVDIVEKAGLAKRVVRLRPLGVIIG